MSYADAMVPVVNIGSGEHAGRRSFTHGNYASWCSPAESGVTIDLSRATFIDTMALVIVAAAAEGARRRGDTVDFVPPSDIEPARYASRMHLGRCLESIGVDAGLPAVQEHDTGSRLSELQRFDAATADELAERVHDAVVDNAGDTHSARDFFLGVSEVMWNTVDHSGAEGGWAAMQVLPRARSPFVTFAVADVGIGLRRTLERSHVVADDSHAISLAFEAGVSGTAERRGMGLPDLCDRVHKRRGEMKVWSGWSRGMSRGPRPVYVTASDTPLAGTIIYASFRPALPRR